ncbi:MAG: transglycosylase domain-containing protein, partial [Clostridia bacterium]|nr:transglycosylase domain-containing protein [Clostridia bacterium]
GVDITRTASATLTFLFNKGTSGFGGSTITQQLVKNITNEKDDSGLEGATRKIKEMVKAYQVENILSKDQIIEMYLNIIFLGGKVHGVEMASQYYFSTSATDLSLAESAFLAGITHSPNSYKPFDEEPNTEKINSRVKTVLWQMLDQNKIIQEEYDEAIKEVDEGLRFKKGDVTQKSYSYHTEAAINQILDQFVNEKGMDREYAKTYLYSSGFTIYTTEDTEIQERMEEEFEKNKYQVKSKKTKNEDGKYVTSQAAMVIIDQSNGYVLGTVGGLGEKTAFGLNRATQSVRQTGSSMKPIAVYGPALQEGIITAGSVYDDTPVTYGKWSPNNVYRGYKGLSNMRYAIRISQNIPAVKVLQDLTPTKSIEYLKDMGITSLNDKEDNSLSLGLGGLYNGVSPLEMAAAYACIANDGEYIEPTFYTKVVDSNGETILEPKQSTKRVFSEQNAYILKQLLKEPVNGSGGTATMAKISGIDVAAKTGTTNDNYDKWLCGFTPYYTAAVWYGFDKNEAAYDYHSNTIWSTVMKDIHKGLDGKKFEKPSNIVTAAICKDSGLLATESCKKDSRGSRVYSEIFVKGTVPKKSCTCHVEAEVCKESGKIATENCKEKETKVFITRETDKKVWEKAADAEYMLPTENCECEYKDETAPVVTLKGEAIVNLELNGIYTEQGATATDNKDGDITSKIVVSGKVDTKKAGTYVITYTITDAAGNVANVKRTVNVKAAAIQEDTNTNTNVNTSTTNTAEPITNTTPGNNVTM